MTQTSWQWSCSRQCEVFIRSPWEGDAMILNIVLVSVLMVYTLFVMIQFCYLFAPSGDLPYFSSL